MDNAWQRYAQAAMGLTELTKKTAETVVQRLVRQGEVAADRAEKYVDDLLSVSERNRSTIASLVKTETERAIGRLGLAKQSEIDRLEARIAELETQGPATAKKAPAKRSAAKKTASKKTTAKKSTAKKTTAKKTTAQRRAAGGGGS